MRKSPALPPFDHMKTAAVIGAGVSGLASAHILSKRYKVTVYEKDARPGGLIKCDEVNGVLYHKVGGHVFNSRRADVLEWFWTFFRREQDFTKATRNAVVSLRDGTCVSYPIENHLYQLPRPTAQAVIRDLIDMAGKGYGEPQNFDEFLRARFGQTLYSEYFEPYNRKIWQCPLSEIPLAWLEGKLPMPGIDEILQANILRLQEVNMVHSSFNYPVRGGSQFIADTLARGLAVRYGTPAEALERRSDGTWRVNGDSYDLVVFCGNIKQLASLLKGGVSLGSELEQGIQALRAHGTTSVLCEVEANPYSWIYLPDTAYASHRIICTGNFSPNNAPVGKHTATVEFTGEVSKDSLLEQLARMPFAPRYLAHHYEPYTYPIQDGHTRPCIQAAKALLEPQGLHLIGRFAEWEYYNMDAAIGAALDRLTSIIN